MPLITNPLIGWRRAFLIALLLGSSIHVQAQTDPPARVAYLSSLEGSVRINTGEYGHWAEAALNWPVAAGSALQLDAGARLELDGGSMVLRVQGPAELNTVRFDDTTTQWTLTGGTASLRLRQLQADERVEIDTPQLAFVATQAGDYRIDVDPHGGTTQVTVRAGSATVHGASGQSLSFGQGRRLVFSGRELRLLANSSAGPLDTFDQWASARDRQREQSASAAYLPPDMPGYPVLDSHGQWAQDATWGIVWYPVLTFPDWAPYRYGRWAWIEPWGWTWIDDAPWGFAPFHYGRWIQIGVRWAWVPQPAARRPVYAPALVQFFAGGTAWFPLAPGEDWHPPYRVSPQYRGRLNDWGHRPYPRPPAGGSLHFQQRPGAISVARHGLLTAPDRTGGPPRFGDASRLPRDWVQDSRIAAPPPRPERLAPDWQRPTPRAQMHESGRQGNDRARMDQDDDRRPGRTLAPIPGTDAAGHWPRPAPAAPRTRPPLVSPAPPAPEVQLHRPPPPQGSPASATPDPSASRAKRRFDEPRAREMQALPPTPHEGRRRARPGSDDDSPRESSGRAGRRTGER